MFKIKYIETVYYINNNCIFSRLKYESNSLILYSPDMRHVPGVGTVNAKWKKCQMNQRGTLLPKKRMVHTLLFHIFDLTWILVNLYFIGMSFFRIFNNLLL